MSNRMIDVGGWSFIAFTVLFFGMQLLLAIAYNYPALLFAPNEQGMKILLSHGASLQAALAIFAITPLLLIPASVGTYYAFRDECEGSMHISTYFATITVVGLMLSLMQWPSINWHLGAYFVSGSAAASQKVLATAMLTAINTFFSIFVGEFVSKVCMIVWFYLISRAILCTRGFPRWVGYIGYAVSIYMLVTLLFNFGIFSLGFQRVVKEFLPIEPLWLIALGAAMLTFKKSERRK